MNQYLINNARKNLLAGLTLLLIPVPLFLLVFLLFPLWPSCNLNVLIQALVYFCCLSISSTGFVLFLYGWIVYHNEIKFASSGSKQIKASSKPKASSKDIWDYAMDYDVKRGYSYHSIKKRTRPKSQKKQVKSKNIKRKAKQNKKSKINKKQNKKVNKKTKKSMKGKHK